MTLSGALGAALVFGLITHHLKISPIAGYILAGVLVGPHTPGFNANPEIAHSLAEVGIILLMFGVGLRFHFSELLKAQKLVFPSAVLQIVVATTLGWVVASHWGWNREAAIVFGLSISVASTVVLTRVLSDSGQLVTPIGRASFGWLVVEDVFTVIALILLPVLFGPAAVPSVSSIAFNVWSVAVKLAGLALFTLLIGFYVIPWILHLISRTRSRELFTLAILCTALGIAVGCSIFFDVSMALGAFLAGLIVGRSSFAGAAANEALPMRDAFAVLFFVSIGMLFDPAMCLIYWKEILMTLALILVGKPLTAFLLMVITRKPALLALSVAAAISQIGEFSFILATAAYTLGVLPPAAMQIIIAASVLSIVINPMIYNSIPKAKLWMHGQPWLRKVILIDEKS